MRSLIVICILALSAQAHAAPSCPNLCLNGHLSFAAKSALHSAYSTAVSNGIGSVFGSGPVAGCAVNELKSNTPIEKCVPGNTVTNYEFGKKILSETRRILKSETCVPEIYPSSMTASMRYMKLTGESFLTVGEVWSGFLYITDSWTCR